MFLADIFEIWIARKNDRMPEIVIVRMMMVSEAGFKLGIILDIATAAPVLVL